MRSRIPWLVTLGVVLLLITLVYRGVQLRVPPDLNGCTRIEITYTPYMLRYLFSNGTERSLLSSTEIQYLQSRERQVVEDQERVKDLAESLKLGSYERRHNPRFASWSGARIVCYRNGKHLASFTLFGDWLETDRHSWLETDRHRWFQYPPDSLNITFVPASVERSFQLRGACASNLRTLHDTGDLFSPDAAAYPSPNQWCDVALQALVSDYSMWDGVRKPRYSKERASAFFICASARELEDAEETQGPPSEPSVPDQAVSLPRSHYAMNRACGPKSPRDVVLLFESRAGWNQCGGPELFTFDNHDPKGGCVMLNNGEVKFIRTEEELKQLRWK